MVFTCALLLIDFGIGKNTVKQPERIKPTGREKEGFAYIWNNSEFDLDVESQLLGFDCLAWLLHLSSTYLFTNTILNIIYIFVAGIMIEVVLNDRLGKKVRVKCNEDDTIGDLKKLAAAQLGTRPEKLRIQKWYTIYKDHITLEDYEIHDGMGLEL